MGLLDAADPPSPRVGRLAAAQALDTLRNLPPLDTKNAKAQTAACKLCSAPAPVFDVVDLNKHCSHHDQYQFGLAGVQVVYHRCRQCGFLFTEFFDAWTSAEFSAHIYNSDYGCVDPDYAAARPTNFASIASRILRGCEQLRVLDYGSGSGLFAEKLRDAGFLHVQSYDPFSSPLPPAGMFDIITCFEVLEHTVWPKQALDDVYSYLAADGCLVFSQSVQPDDIEKIRAAWWYLAPRNGHVSTFTIDGLRQLLRAPDHCLRGNGWLWALSPPAINPLLRPALEEIGPKILSMTLTAPPCGDDHQFHPAERSSCGGFRWSSTACVEWRPDLSAARTGTLRLRVPFALEIRDGFAASASIEVDGVPGRVIVGSQDLIAELQVDRLRDDAVVTLRTPALQSPHDARGAPDARQLGLGILIAGPEPVPAMPSFPSHTAAAVLA